MDASIRAPGVSQLSGRLESFPSFEILQVVVDLRKRGELRMRNEDGRSARCVVASGFVFEPFCGHLEGLEALVAMSWWTRGSFELFPVEADVDPGSPLRLPEVLMDAVRIADEIERRSDHLPEREEPLALVPGSSALEDDLACELPTLFSYLDRNPGTTLIELEKRLPLAPTKIRLGVALLREAGLLASAGPATGDDLVPAGREGGLLEFEELDVSFQGLVEDQPGASRGGASPDDGSSWWRRILGQYPGGVRALVVCPSGGLPDDAFPALTELAGSLGATDPSFSFAADGPSFVRIRPAGGGILSITFLPLARKHHYLFLALVKSVEAVFLCADDSGRAELDAWEGRIPKRVKVVRFEEGKSVGDEIGRNVRQIGTGP